MERTLQVLNELTQSGVMGGYAIGGAMAATFYVEPTLTFDLDVFTVLPETAGGLVTLEPLYSALRARGFVEADEYIDIAGVPVQFLPVHNELLREALAEARETLYASTRTRVLRAEHLIAIALQTGRSKDRHRIQLLMEYGELDTGYLAGVLARHGLEAKWDEWKR